MSAVMPVGSGNFVDRSQEIRTLVAGNEVLVAIRKTMDFVQSFSSRGEYLDESTVLSMEWRQIDDAVLRGDLSFEQASAARKKLARQMLGLVRSVEDGARVELGHD